MPIMEGLLFRVAGRGRVLDNRRVHYQSRKQMELGVQRLSDEGWTLRNLSPGPQQAVIAELVRTDVTSPQRVEAVTESD